MTELVIGIELDLVGSHRAAWRFATHPPHVALNPEHIAGQARHLDEAGYDFLSLRTPPEPGEFPTRNPLIRLSATELAGFLAGHTHNIGIVVDTNTIRAEAFHLANQLASVDWTSGGWAGWIPTIDETPAIAASFNEEEITDTDRLHREAVEVVTAVRRIWDTWEDGAILADQSIPRFFNLERWHNTDFVGEFFTVEGPSIVARPPQGQLVVFGYAGDNLGEGVDVVFLDARGPQEVSARAAAARAAGARSVIQDVRVVLAADSDAAARRLAELEAAGEWNEDRPALLFAGTPAALTELLAGIADHVDGVRLLPAVNDVDIPLLSQAVLPALAERGVHERATIARTLTERLALAPRQNVFALERAAR
ncbi:nitrilotriacetate monooxygenase [Mycetocola tolaasinivorans]|uniref:Nitrilotriacetate monooxygenase n=1 Tax=Mycetocola tolaasinivorans TaxID=76635 RepID=A0A3L7A5S1_9MICO|nr:nitrilotriacetate monooxygenase [Mycetocola tolaasinivorans]RLP75278.1 nitrilotriacetate monooxygenase [Mycetocola tolaasinivorans]